MWKEVTVDRWIAGRKSSLLDVRAEVVAILERVKNEGDAALKAMSRHVVLDEVPVREREVRAAYDTVDPAIVRKLTEASERIERFHKLQRPRNLWLETMEPGIVLGVKTTPLHRVGIYVPGGRAAYPSTALMCAIPARVAGVREICACSPPPIKPLTLVSSRYCRRY